MAHKLDDKEYEDAFSSNGKKKEALERALETRKFEIELYWKRASYFWTFIAAALAAYGVIQASKDIEQKSHLSVLVGVLGFVFSFAWQAVNRGSKHWQENWENHVAILEDDIIGPLYKTVSRRPRATGFKERIRDLLTGPRDYSVSKINQLVSLFVMSVWLSLVIREVWPSITMTASPDVFSIIVIILGAGACLLMGIFGRSHSHDHEFIVTQHTSQIIKDENTVPASGVPSD